MFLFDDPTDYDPIEDIENRANPPATSVGKPMMIAAALGVGGFAFTGSAIVGGSLAAVPAYMLIKTLKRAWRNNVFLRRNPGCYAHLIKSDRDIVQWLEAYGRDDVADQLQIALKAGQRLTPAAKRTAKLLLQPDQLPPKNVAAYLAAETTAVIDSSSAKSQPTATATAQTANPAASQQTGQNQEGNPQHEQNRFIDVLMGNPYQSRAIIAGQRTGKTYGAAVATYCLAQDGTHVFYINLFDHGQGNREAFSHARSVIGDLDKLTRDDGADLVASAIDVIQQFKRSSDAILVVDEWMILGSENRDTPGIDRLWRLLGDETSRLCSNGIGNGRAIWGIAPFYKAGQLRRDAKLLKECSPLVLSITPGHSVPWTNPRSGKVTQVEAQPQIIGDVLTNWPGCGIQSPTDEQSRQWRRESVERIYWNQGQWHPMGSCPSLPTPKQQNHPPVGGDTTPARSFAQGVATLIKEPPIAVRTEVANALINAISASGKGECLVHVKQLKDIGQEQAAFRVMVEALGAASKTAFCAGFGITGGAKFQTFGQVYDWAMGE
jgi:hypothetical protein